MKKDLKEQNHGFAKEEQEKILQETFKVGDDRDKCDNKSLQDIIDSVINAIRNNVFHDDNEECIRKYWFTKQIEEWKENKKEEENNADKEPSYDELMEIVKKDLKVRMANTMLALEQELEKHKDIKKDDIWFYQKGEYVILRHNNDDICRVSDFNFYWQHISPPYKPFFMKNTNDHNNLNGVCIYKHGDDKTKTKWIMACFNRDYTMPQCKITFKTNKNNKIKNVEIQTAKDKNSESTYTISLDDNGDVAKITKAGEKDNRDKNHYNDKINNLLFKDGIFKVLRERIEDELDSQQKVVFDKIKKHLGIKEEKNKENKDNANNQIIINEKEKGNENSSLQINLTNNPAPKYTLCCLKNDYIGFDGNGNWHCGF